MERISLGLEPIDKPSGCYYDLSVRVTDPNYLARRDLPYNIHLLINDIMIAPKHIEQTAIKSMIQELNNVGMKRKYMSKYIISHWITSSDVSSIRAILDTNIYDIIIKFQNIVIFDRDSLMMSITRYIVMD